MAMRARFTPPGGAQYPLGTDAFGRDVLSRLLHGARVSLRIGALVVLVSGIAGARHLARDSRDKLPARLGDEAAGGF
jgi:ABC-type dipeptide/oligopeptide/nickel transport system permease subunit